MLLLKLINETWSKAREHSLAPSPDEQLGGRATGPRVLRTLHELWGMDSLSIREMRQILIGNHLLLFSSKMLVLLYITGGCGALEHPAPPKSEELASIWRTQIALLLCKLPGILRVDFLLGAKSPKPTSILALNLPDTMDQIRGGRVCTDLPLASSIGRMVLASLNSCA